MTNHSLNHLSILIGKIKEAEQVGGEPSNTIQNPLSGIYYEIPENELNKSYL